MFLFRRRISCLAGFTHPLKDNQQEQMSDERKLELIMQLYGGDARAIDELVQGYLQLAINIASQYARSSPNYANDMVSEALLGIIIACNDIMAQKVDKEKNLCGYIVLKIHAQVSKFVEKNDIITISRRTQRRQGLKPPTCKNKHVVEKLYEHQTTFELQEMLDKVIRTELERRIIDLRAASMVDREIADKLDLSVARVAQIRNEVLTRFENLEASM